MTITTQFLTGWEHGLLSANGGGLGDTISGTGWSIASSGQRNGSFCLHLIQPASSPHSYIKLITGSPTKLVFRVAIRVTSGNLPQIYLNGVSNTNRAVLQVVSGAWAAGAGTGVVTGSPVNVGAYDLVEMQVDVSVSPWTIAWKINGVAQPAAPQSVTVDTLVSIVLGNVASSGSAQTLDYDDFIVGTWTNAATDWYGNGQVLGQLAGSDGTHATVADFSPGDAGTAYSGTVTNAWTLVSDAPGTGGWTTTRSTTDNIAQRVIATTAYMEIAPATTAHAGSANAVRALLSYSSVATQANTMACIVRNSGGNPVVVFGDLPTAQGGLNGAPAAWNVTANTFKGAIVSVPVAGWTAAEVNAVRWRIGGSNDIAPVPTVQALMLEVDWPVVAAAGLTPGLMGHRQPARDQRTGGQPSRGRF